MKLNYLSLLLLLGMAFSSTSCNKKAMQALQADLDNANATLAKRDVALKDYSNKLDVCNGKVAQLEADLRQAQNTRKIREEQISDLKDQVQDIRQQRDKQLTQVDDLTVLSQTANQNIGETLQQLERKDEYIQLLQAAKTKTDSINLALAVNLKSVLSQGIADDDVNIKVDKTVVMINLSDKMLFTSGSSQITSRANEVLGKIAQIIESRPDLEVMVEGYTDNVPIRNSCMEDNWDLSVKRSTSVVRALQKGFNIDPNRLIAAGRGEYNTLADNATAEGRATNRRTSIIIMPKLDQFYDLLNPANVPD